MKVKEVKDLKPAPYNPRKISDRQLEMLGKAMAEFGDLSGIVVNKRTGRIVGGHQRLKKMEPSWPITQAPHKDDVGTVAIGHVDTPYGRWQYREVDWDEAKEKAANIAANKHGGDFDFPLLADLLGELDTGDLDMDLTGFDADELEKIAAWVPEGEGGSVGLTDPDHVPDPPAEPITKPGDVWVLGDHRLMCGDAANCNAILPQQPYSVVFDPPYDAENSVLDLRFPGTNVLLFTDHRHTLDCINGWDLPFRNIFAWDGQTSWYVPGQPLARGKFCLWFGNSQYNSEGAHYGEPETGEKIVSNPRGSYNYKPDPRGKHLSTVFSSPATKQFKEHPHSKPVDWVRLLIGNCTAGPIFDPFAGSGTALIACEQLNRQWLGVEISPIYCDVVVKRWEDFTGQKAFVKK